MGLPASHVDSILEALQERAKELDCLYKVNEICGRIDASTDQILRDIVDVIPTGWMYPDDCGAQITVQGVVHRRHALVPTPWVQSSPIRVEGKAVGTLEVFYRKTRPAADEGPFLREERKLIDALAERIGRLLVDRWRLASLPGREDADKKPLGEGGELWLILDSFLKTDHDLLVQIVRRMINTLAWSGCAAAQELLPRVAGGSTERRDLDALRAVAEETFRIASDRLSTPEILTLIQKWIQDDRSSFLIEAVENQGTSMTEIARALERFLRMATDDHDLSRTVQVALRVSLARRFLTDDLDFIDTAKSYVSAGDFCDLSRRIIFLPKSHGRIGGKGSGLFLASQIVKRSEEYADALRTIKVPRTWHLLSDGVLGFIEHNHIRELYDRKYLEIDQVRREYPHTTRVLRSSAFPSEFVNGITLALDDLEDRPLVVRSSSLLEGRVGHSFSGKYRSVFLANQGTKPERLAALLDAVAEVYASLFGPDPIAYRAERGLLDLHEEMGILIQEVVGNRVGPWFFPTLAGVALSSSPFRFPQGVERDDGLVRLVPGLGTRAVHRVADASPVLLALGAPGFRLDASAENAARHAPRKIDVINLEKRTFETVDLEAVLREHGSSIPGIEDVVSRPSGGLKSGAGLAVTFAGLVERTPFVPRVRALLRLLKEKTAGPVDIELAWDGTDLYLLEFMRKSPGDGIASKPLPAGIPRERTVFTANRFVSSGAAFDLTHVVYVDPASYSGLRNADLERVGRALGRLNRILPRRRFILMGPALWGVRGDASLGVSVTDSDISNTACVAEIAPGQGCHAFDLPFGTHFFRGLVESSIAYLPLFPGDEGIVFDEQFLKGATNTLGDLLPDFGDLAGAVRVIDVSRSAGGSILRLVMSADLDRAGGYLVSPADGTVAVVETPSEKVPTT